MIPTVQSLTRVLLALVIGTLALSAPGKTAVINDTTGKQIATGQVDQSGQLTITVPTINETITQPAPLSFTGGSGEKVSLTTADGRTLTANNGCVFDYYGGNDVTGRADPDRIADAIRHACDGVKVTVTGTKVMTPTANISITVPVTVTNPVTNSEPAVTPAEPPVIEYLIPGTPYSLKAEYWGHVIALENKASSSLMGLDERWVVELVSSFEDAWIEGRIVHITYVNPTGQYILYDYTLPASWPDATMP